MTTKFSTTIGPQTSHNQPQSLFPLIAYYTYSPQTITKEPKHYCSSSSPSTTEPVRQQYVYVNPNKKGPQSDYQAKPKSRLSKFMSRFQSPAVKATNSIREREREEEVKSGVTKTQVSDAGRSSNAWALS